MTFAAFGWDKRQARRDGQRMSESYLLSLSFFGGSPAAKFAQKRFRHKTRKQPFGMQLNAIIAIQVAGLSAGLVWLLMGRPL
ncbi:MAG: DUF1294 domain-containing protein [Boseongicola sp.]|nr:DUF1294 domain-containing protein [Boseongicola sp.]